MEVPMACFVGSFERMWQRSASGKLLMISSPPPHRSFSWL